MTDDLRLPKPGELMGAKYRVERLLGTGGMGAVYEASHRVTGKRFALKLLLPELTARDDVVKRFIREAQVAGRFQHPNVVEIYDLGEYGESFFMVMELLRGESLAERLERETRLPIAEACEIIRSCLDGVACAHAAGIIHRDLKPANIFLCQTRTPGEYLPKVLDFGISKLVDHPDLPKATTTDTGTVMGTPFYMAPEQLRSKGVDHRVDIYSLGVTLYQLLSGSQPFVANNYPDLVIKIWTESPAPLETLVPGIPAALAAAVAQAMARNADDRFANADAMARALAAFAPAAGPQRVAARSPAPQTSSPALAPKPLSPRAASDLETTQRTATPFASESLAWPRQQRQRVPNTRIARWLIGACALAAVGYGVWREVSAEELPAARTAPPTEPPQPVAAAQPAQTVSTPPAATAAPAVVNPPEPSPPAEQPEQPEESAAPPPTAARRRSPPRPAAGDADPILPFQRPNPSIDRTQF